VDTSNYLLHCRLIEESVSSTETAYYRPAHLVFDPWKQCLTELNQRGRRGPCRLLCVKLVGLPALRIRLPGWVSVQVVPR
jgi:hypothetical protein